MGKAVVALAAVASLMFSSSAFGAILVPPGKSGANQYFEDVPTSQGSAAPPGSGGGPTSSPRTIASLGHGRAGTRALARLGKDGQAAAALAQATAPTRAPGSSGGAGTAGGSGSSSTTGDVGHTAGTPVPSVSGASPTSAISHALAGSGGMGVFFPLLLIVSVLIAVVTGVWRLRRGAGAGPTQPTG